MSDTESKSEIRRLAFQDPTGTAAKLIQCQAQLAQAHETIKDLTQERDRLKTQYEAVKNDPDYQQCCALREKLERENHRLRELAEKALDRISVDDVEWAGRALHAARREEEAQS